MRRISRSVFALPDLIERGGAAGDERRADHRVRSDARTPRLRGAARYSPPSVVIRTSRLSRGFVSEK